jgi:hypothetical protein
LAFALNRLADISRALGTTIRVSGTKAELVLEALS